MEANIETGSETTAPAIELVAPAAWWADFYPAQYYAYPSNSAAIGGNPVVGWVDVAMFSSAPSWLPPASDMIPLSQAEWDARQLVNQVIINGAVSACTPPAPVIPLKDQAATALASARTYVSNNYAMLNEATPDAWVTYLKALMAISGGTDTTSTTLPTQPTN